METEEHPVHRSRLVQLCLELLGLLESIEVSDNGMPFHPTTIHSCRVEDCAKLGAIIPEMKEICSGRADIGKLARRFWTEFMEPAGMTTADDVAERDPQEMAVFAFLVGAGLSWGQARKSENLDILSRVAD